MALSAQSIDRSYFVDAVAWQRWARTEYNELPEGDIKLLEEFIGRLSASAANDSLPRVNIVDFLHEKKIELNVLTEQGPLVIMMFMEFFKYLEHVLIITPKYSSLEKFLAAYEKFHDHDPSEQTILMRTANWVSAILDYIPAKKNKGLIIRIVPKYVEGIQTRYVTGSGQTHATNDRVHIYEVEGDVVRAHRQAPKRPRAGSGLGTTTDTASVTSVTNESTNGSGVKTFPTEKVEKSKRRVMKPEKVLLDIDDRINMDSGNDILSNECLSIVAPLEKVVSFSNSDLISRSDQGETPQGDSSPYLKKVKLTREITWGIDVNKKMKVEEDGLYGFPSPHQSYHFAGEALDPTELCRTNSR